jgi:hypothetical protein
MKRFNMILGITLLLATSAFAAKSTLIDFSQLVPDQGSTLNAATTVDFSKQAGTSYTTAEKAAMKISLAINSWEVELASSARTISNESMSLVKEAPVSQSSTSAFAGKEVMGVRVHFPEYGVNSYAIIKPPFDIPAYATDSTNPNAKPGTKFDGYGILKNVGVIKSIKIDALGRNFPNGISLLLEDQNGVDRQIFMGYLNFDGWKSIQWNNPDYQTDVRNRELAVTPLYPQSQPYIKLKGIVIHRDSEQAGGDFVSYFGDIQVIYDEATLPGQSDVDDEAIWGIREKKEEDARNAELARLGNLQVLRQLAKDKMATESFNTTNSQAAATSTSSSSAASTTTPAATTTAPATTTTPATTAPAAGKP